MRGDRKSTEALFGKAVTAPQNREAQAALSFTISLRSLSGNFLLSRSRSPVTRWVTWR